MPELGGPYFLARLKVMSLIENLGASQIKQRLTVSLRNGGGLSAIDHTGEAGVYRRGWGRGWPVSWRFPAPLWWTSIILLLRYCRNVRQSPRRRRGVLKEGFYWQVCQLNYLHSALKTWLLKLKVANTWINACTLCHGVYEFQGIYLYNLYNWTENSLFIIYENIICLLMN